MTNKTDSDFIRDHIRNRYAKIAKNGSSCCGGDCCSPTSSLDPDFSSRLGYGRNDLDSVPDGSNMGLGCGNPQAIARLAPGETVLDLGCGFDCFLAARQIGPEGKVIGVDMTSEMIAKARINAREGGYLNVEFRLGEIEHLPAADNSVDVIISNCVINLSPDKEQVFCDAYRVLRPGGRLIISDVVAVGPLPEIIRQDTDALCGCIAGAGQIKEIERMIREAGFAKSSIQINEKSKEFIRDWFPGTGFENFVRSAEISAWKQPK
jgi:SAM-dependent methyltransferase